MTQRWIGYIQWTDTVMDVIETDDPITAIEMTKEALGNILHEGHGCGYVCVGVRKAEVAKLTPDDRWTLLTEKFDRIGTWLSPTSLIGASEVNVHSKMNCWSPGGVVSKKGSR